MKKALILTITTFLMVFSIILTSGNVKAETQEITPFYSGDILNGKDLYLFQELEPTPNFENGYLNKKTISSTDIYYSGNSNYNGWYKDLGMDLIDEITAPEYNPENPYYTFYVTFDDMMGQYFQLATRITGPYLTDFYIKFRDESPLSLLNVDESGGYILITDNTQTEKQIEWIAWSAYYPDYLASFRPLTADLAYQFGLESGYWTGYENGVNVGYGIGYNNGLEDGLIQGSEPDYVSVQNYNELVRNGNFNNSSYWETLNLSASDLTISDNTAIITPSLTRDGGIYVNLLTPFLQEHKYFMFFDIWANNENPGGVRMRYPFETPFTQITTNKNRKYFYYNGQNLDNASVFFIQIQCKENYTYYIKNVVCIDLSVMYGLGYEPTMDICQNIFKSEFYPYSTGEVININYYDGYNDGKNDGYVLGSNAQATKQLTATGWIQGIFGGISSLLNIQIFPGVTIGLIVGIPFVITLAYFVIRAFRGGGGA